MWTPGFSTGENRRAVQSVRIRSWTTWWRSRSLSTGLVDEKQADGRPLLGSNPLARVSVPTEEPRRPVADASRYDALRAVAAQVSPVFAFALELCAGTGHRIGAVLALRWRDVLLDPQAAAAKAAELDSGFGWTVDDFPHGGLQWYAERRTNNKVTAYVAPITAAVRQAVESAQRERPAIAGALLFPDPRDPSRQLDRYVLGRWLREAETTGEDGRDQASSRESGRRVRTGPATIPRCARRPERGDRKAQRALPEVDGVGIRGPRPDPGFRSHDSGLRALEVTEPTPPTRRAGERGNVGPARRMGRVRATAEGAGQAKSLAPRCEVKGPGRVGLSRLAGRVGWWLGWCERSRPTRPHDFKSLSYRLIGRFPLVVLTHR